MRNLSEVPKLGVGIVWWPELDALCRPGAGLVQVIEAEPETFWTPSSGNSAGFTSHLPPAVAHLPQPKLLHGVGAPFCGQAEQSAGHCSALSGDIAALRPAWISDHLSFNSFPASAASPPAQPVFTGFFMPPAQCPDGVAQAAAHIKRRRETSGMKVAFENAVSYLPPLQGEMPDGDFIAAVAEAADCGILLDLHNALCNERNGRQSVRDLCDAIPLDRVWEIHLAGGEEERGFWLDAHCGPVEPALMEILADIVPRLPALGAIVFEILPEWVARTGLPAIAGVLEQVNDIWARRRAPPARNPTLSCDDMRFAANLISPAQWETAIGAAVTGHQAPDLPPNLARFVAGAEAPLSLYRYLAQEGRASSLVFVAPHSIRAVLRRFGEAETRHLLARFWRDASPAYTAAGEGDAFLTFLAVAAPEFHADIAADREGLKTLLS